MSIYIYIRTVRSVPGGFVYVYIRTVRSVPGGTTSIYIRTVRSVLGRLYLRIYIRTVRSVLGLAWTSVYDTGPGRAWTSVYDTGPGRASCTLSAHLPYRPDQPYTVRTCRTDLRTCRTPFRTPAVQTSDTEHRQLYSPVQTSDHRQLYTSVHRPYLRPPTACNPPYTVGYSPTNDGTALRTLLGTVRPTAVQPAVHCLVPYDHRRLARRTPTDAGQHRQTVPAVHCSTTDSCWSIRTVLNNQD